jgi:uncharacterized protein (TIGR00290 family)
MKEKVLFAWSSGKDSAEALFELRNGGRYEVVALLSTITADRRISTHGVGTELLGLQAASLGLPLEKVCIPDRPSNEAYELAMKQTLLAYKGQGVTSVAFGDIFLEDLKDYREKRLAEIGMSAVFPLWKRDTGDLALSFIHNGFEAIVTCVDAQALDGGFAGRRYDRQFVADLPSSVDPCGEMGEFHTFVYAGPIFKNAISFRKGGITVRENRFYFCEIMPS